jgi:hydrocephalus-inducing protein
MMAPSEERFINANIALSIKRKPALIFLNVKGEGYDLHDRVMLQDEVSSTSDQRPGTESRSSGAALELSSAVLSSTGVNFVDFGTVQVNEKAVKRVMITNNGAFSFDFNWALGSSESLLAGAAGARALASTLRAARMQASPGRENQRAIRVTPEAGKVPKGGSITCELEFRPTSQVSIAGLALTCTVANVKKYQVSVSAVGGKPALEFSTVNLDFGDCIVLPPSMGVPAVAVTRLIRITNRESDRDVSLQCTFERRPHLDVGLDAAVLRPGDTIDVPVIFTPRATANYVETVPFEVNSLHTVNVNVTGEGVFCSFELVNAAHSDLSFGALRPSQTATRNVKIGNVCRRAILLDVVDEDGSLIPSTVNSPGGDIPRLRKKFVSAASTRLFAKGKDSTQLELTFSPPSRVPSFSEPLYVRVGAADNKGVLYGSFSDRIPLLKLSGACLGMDVMLEMDSIPFGSVCEGSSLTKLCHIYNGGDVPTSFKFDTNRFGRNFSISPATGFLPPHSDCQLRITFAPVRVGKDVRADDIRCQLDGAPDPLFLSLTGDCVPRPAPSGSTINFECKVRDSTSQNIKLPSNPTDQPWTLTPVLSNPFWTAPSVIEVPAKGSVDLPVTYKPLFMTVKDGPNEPPPALPGSAAAHDPTLLMVGLSVHTGTVFIPLPDGTGTLYNLSGKAQPPSNLAPISAKGTAKKSISFVVPIKNWLRSTQRFVVSWDSSKVPQAAQLKGARTIDVPGLGEREYKLSYTNALEGKSSIPLTFTNEGTGEYINTTLELETSAPGVEGEIKLTAPVRQIASHVISVPNALAASQTPITWNPWPPQCSNPAIRVTPLGNMRGMPDGSFRIDFRPRVPTKMPGGEEHVAGTPPPPPESAKLTLRSPELGDFNFDLLLSASACGPESLLHFSAPLGSSAKNLFRFRAFDAKPGQASGFTCKVDKPELFSVPATFSVPALPAGVEPWDGQDASVEVTFEGTSLSEKAVVGMLTITSDNSGSTWTVPLSGVCSTPRPSGPYNLTPTGPPVSINFRNVFNEEREFVVSTDVPQAFSISPVGVLKVAKKTTQALSVTYKAPSDGSSPRGKLIVSCPSAPGEPSWVFYLHGAPVEVIHAAQTTNPSRPASGAAKKK